MEENTIKISHIILLLIMIGTVIVVGTYAWLSYRTNHTAMVLTIGEINNVQVTLSPYQIKASLLPQVTYTSDNYVTVTAVNNSTSPRKINLYYKINSIDNELISSNFKYTIERSTDGTTYTQYQTGNFSSASNGAELTILEEKISSKATYYYKVYLWIDGSNSGQSYMQGKSFNGELRANIDSLLLQIQYQQLEYIQSNGTQYIDTGYYPSQSTGIYVDYQFTDLTKQQRLFGTDSDNSSNKVSFGYYINGSGLWAYAHKNGAGNWISTGITANANRHTLKFDSNDNKIYIDDGNTYQNTISGSITNTSDYTLVIFARNNMGTITHYGKIKLYEFIIYDNHEEVRHFIPCYRKSDGVIGLYDLINNNFYTNSGTGTFEIGTDILPSEYQYVEYLESDGNQYIDTGYIPNQNTRIYTKASTKGVSGHTGLFGCRTTDYTYPVLSYIESSYGGQNNIIRIDAGGVAGSTGINWTVDDFFTIDVDLLNSKVLVNGNTITRYDSMSYPTSCDLSISVFAVHQGTSYLYPIAGKIYSFIIYENGTQVRNLVPCYRKSDKVKGLYDTINNVFYTNAGTGAFSTGPEI